MAFYSKLYDSAPKRVVMRFVEAAVVCGVIGALEFGLGEGLIPAVYVGIVMAVLKFLRELSSKK